MSIFETALVAHLVADWLLQNEWMAIYKVKLEHPAAWVHAAIHGLCLMAAFPFLLAVNVAIVHALVDTRVPLTWWRRVFGQTTEGPMAPHVAIWTDQVLHILILALATRLI